jgi:hypothetical protein
LQITFLACKEHILSGALNIVIASQVWARGIAKKDIPLFLRCIALWKKDILQKRHLHALHRVSEDNSPGLYMAF